MKGSPKVIRQEKGSTSSGIGTSPYKSSPTFKGQGRQSVKVTYGLDDDSSDLPSTSSPSPATQSSKKSGINPSRLAKAANAANLKPKSKPSPTSATRGNGSNKTSTQTSSTSISHQRHQQQPLARKGKCEICQKICTSHCAGCKRVFYCSKQHQQKDWSKHKLVCRPFSIPTQHSSKSHIWTSGSGGVVSSSSSFNTSSNNNDQSFLGGDAPAPNLSQEHQFMVSTKQIAAGSLLFTEQPLLVAANVFGPLSKGDSNIWCCSCLKVMPNPGDNLNNNNSSSEDNEKPESCPICQVPLCHECLRHLGRSNTAGPPNNFYAGQGHSAEECALISDLCQKAPEVMNFINSCNDCQCAADLMKDLSILRVLMLRTISLWRWESLITLKNSPRYIACCRHNLGNLEGWLGSTQGYPVSTYYLKNICKEKNLLLGDIVKIVAVFCEVSARNPSLLVLYENLSWLAHACTPNAEQFFRQTKASEDPNGQANELDILVKAVNKIDEHSKITVNYLTHFEGGRSALALRLFQAKGHYCCDSNCVCYQPRSFDKTMGIRCDIIFNTHACSGILSPRIDAPNPEKSNLGLGMFVKSKKWECDKCKKSEKYESLHKRIMEIAQDLTGACDRCCNSSSSAGGFGKGQQPPFLQLQSKLLYHLSDEHWMLWKAKLRILKSWTASTGYGPAMVRSFLSSESSSLQETQRTGLIYVLKQKVELYGDGIYTYDMKVKSKMGVLELLAKRHGQLSPKRGHLLFDAFYANLLVLVEDYKKELPLGQSDLKRGQISKEYCKKMVILRNLLEQAVESLQLAEGTTLCPSSVKSFRVAKESLDVISKVCSKVEQRPNLIISYLNDFLELYACQDPNFINTRVRKSQSKSDPFMEGLVENDCLDFEVDSINLGTGASFAFGAAGTLSQGVRKSWIGSNYRFGASDNTGANPFGFSGFGSPSFGLSDLESDIDDDDNPFVYSKTSKTKSSPKGNDNESPRASRNKSGSGSKNKGDTDWSSYFWFSSDDDDDNDNPLDDDFDLGFTSSPRSTFGGDLFNDQELDDLAEWAALQFMMGKMKL